MRKFYATAVNDTNLTSGNSQSNKYFMRKLYVLSMLLMAGLFLNKTSIAQVSNYTFAASSGTYSPITGTTVHAAGWDDAVSAVPIGFSFTFNGVTYTTCSVNSNGYITFGTTVSSSSTYVPISDNTGYGGAISAWGRDLQAQPAATTGLVQYSSTGGVFTLQWSDTRRYYGSTANAERINFQIKLYQTTNVIQVVYGTWSNAISATSTIVGGQVGLRGASNTDFNNLSVVSGGNWASPTNGGANTNTSTCYFYQTTVATKPASGQTYTWTPPAPCAAPTALAATPTTITPTINTISFNAFGAASPAPTGYVVVRSTSPADPTLSDGTTYSVGANATVATNGYIEYVGATPGGWTSTGLSGGTTYYYWIFSQNNTTCSGGPAYSTVSNTRNFFAATSACASYSGTMTVGPTGTFTSLGQAITNLTACGYTGNIILELQPAYVSSVETFPLAFPATLPSSASKTITIRPAAGATNLSITSSNATGTINLNGAKYITFDGRAGGAGSIQMTVENTNTAGYAVQFINDATNNVLQYIDIRSVNTGTGTIVFGTTTGTTGNDNNLIDHCEIRDGATTPAIAIGSVGSTGSTALNNSNNTISNNNIYNFFSATLDTRGIYLGSGNTDWTISGNSLYQTTATRTITTGATTFIFIFIDNTSGNNFTVSNNRIGGMSSVATGVSTISATVTARYRGISLNVGSATASAISHNVIQNLTLSSSSGATTAPGIFSGIYLNSGWANITGNSVGGFGVPIAITASTTGGISFGIVSAASSATSYSVSDNFVQSITVGGNAAAISQSFDGINIASGTTVNVNTNYISSIATSATTTSPVINGINIAGGTTINTYANKIVTLSSAATGTSTLVSGIRVASGTTNNIYNNIIGTLEATAVSSTDAVRGINLTGTTSTTSVNVSFNTISLTASSSGTNFGTTGIYHTISTTATTASLTMRNNIISNTSTPAGTGLTVAFRRSSGGANSLANYNAASNNNLFYAGTPSASNLIYSDGTSTAQTITAYKGGAFTAGTISPRDASSVTENPTWQSTTPSNLNYLYINTITATQIESGGTPVSGITVDIEGTTRNATTPDIGAYEFAGVTSDLTAPSISYTPLSTSCSGARTLVATITDASGVPTTGVGVPTLYFRILPAVAWTAVSPSSVSGSNFTYIFAGAAVGGETVQYYIVAQDNAATPNAGAFPAAGATGFTINPPAASTPPTTPSSFVVAFTLNGNYSVGASNIGGEAGHYATLTLAAAAYNTACITGPVNFILTDAAYASETYPIVFTANATATPANKLTIKPNAGVAMATFSGSNSSTLIKLNGADYVTIDGSNNGTATQNLTFINTNTGSPAVIWIASTATDGATNNTIKNTIINGNSGTTTYAAVMISGSTLGSAAEVSNSFTTVTNNTISKTQFGILGNGNATTPDQTWNFSDNVIGATVTADKGIKGILVQSANGFTVSGNTIKGVSAGTTSSISTFGIAVSLLSSNGNILKNNISDVKQLNTTGYGANGILLSSTSTSAAILVANNFVSDIAAVGYASGSTSADNGYGIIVEAGAGYNIYYNTVLLNTSQTLTTGLPAAFNVTSGVTATGAINLVNNIFVNTQTLASTTRYAIYSSAANTVFGTINYNDYYSAGANVGYIGSNRTNLAGIQAGFLQNANSVAVLPVFANAAPDLHLQRTGNSALNAGATPVSVSVDIDNDARDASTPDIGADEFVPCSPVPSATISVSPSASICVGDAVTLTETGSNNTSWTWSPGGQTTNAITVSPTTTTTYSVTAVQSAGCQTIVSQTITVNALPTALTVTPSTSNVCEGAIQTLTTSGGTVTGVPLLSQNFNSGLGSWTVANVATTTAGTEWLLKTPPYTYSTSITSWTGFDGSNFMIANSDIGGSGSITNTRLVSPAFSTVGATAATLNFKHFFRSSTTEVNAGVEYSLDGTTWTPVTGATYTNTSTTGAGNNPPTVQNVSLPLNAAALGQASVQIRFRYDATWDYYWGLDDISLTATMAAPVTWTPITELYTDALATAAYALNTPAATVYSKPTANRTYTATATSPNNCISTATATVNVSSVTAALSGGGSGCAGATQTLTVNLTGTAPWSITYTDGVTSVTIPGITLSPYSFTVTPAATSTYTLTAASDASCSAVPAGLTGSATVTANAAPVVSAITSAGGATTVCAASPLTLTAHATAGSGTITTYQWFNGATPVGTNSPTFNATLPGSYTVTVTNSNTCSATSAAFNLSAASFNINATVTGTGTITPSGITSVVCGNSQTYTITAGTCYSIADVTVDGVSQGAITSYTFSNVSADHTINATFTLNTYTITVTAGANGTITPVTGSVNCGDNATYTITPNACYSIASVVVDGVSQGAIGTYTFNNVASNHTISATFVLNTYNIVASAGPNGSISPAGTTSVNCGSTQVYTFTPDVNYDVLDVIVDGVSQGASAGFTFTNVTANHTINVIFVLTGCANPPTANAGADASTCGITPFTLAGTATNAAASWTTSGTGTFNGGGIYPAATTYTPSLADVGTIVTLTLATEDPDGGDPCVAASSSMQLTVNPTPTASISGTLSYCAGQSTVLTANVTAGTGSAGITTYQWFNGATPVGGNLPTLTVTAPGSYTVTVTNAESCPVTSAAVVVVENALPAAPTIAVTGSLNICLPGSVTLTSSYSTGNVWAPNGEITDAITVSTSGSYTVTYTDGNGCASTSLPVVVSANASPTITSVTASCPTVYPASSVTLTATATAGSGTITTYQWFNGATPVGTNSATLITSTAGSYTVTVTNSNNCSVTSSPVVLSAFGGALNGTYTIGSACGFPTIAAAVNYLNANGVSGAVTFNVAASYTETAPAGGYVIGGAGSVILSGGTATSAANTVNFNGNSAVVTAPVQTAGSVTDAIFKLVGADYITLSGFAIRENAANTTYADASNNATEWGIALLYNSATDGAQNNTIQNNNIQLNRLYPNSVAIYSNTRHTATAPTVVAEVTAATGSNSNNKVYGNTIQNVNTAISFVGANTAANMDNGNDIGGTSAGTGNTISNYGSNTLFTTIYVGVPGAILGINGVNQSGVNISYNSVISASLSNALALRGILTDYPSAVPTGTVVNNLTNNTVTFTQGGTSSNGTIQGITTASSGGASAANITENINNNNIINNAVTGTASAAAIIGVGNLGIFGTLNMNDNKFYGNTTTSTTASFIPLTNQAAVLNTININNNQIGNASGNAVTYSVASSGAIYGVFNTAAAAGATLNINGNDIQKIVHNANSSGGHNYIYNSATTAVLNINNNTFTNITARTNGTVYFILLTNAVNVPATGTQTIDNNRIVTGFNKTLAGEVNFVRSVGNSVAGATINWTNNNFSNVTVTGASSVTGLWEQDGVGANKNTSGNTISNITGGSSAITGILNDYGGSVGNGNIISNNVISNISSTGGALIGINSGGNATSGDVFGNTVSGLSTTGTGAVTGIASATASNGNIYKNYVYNLSSTNAGAVVNGITASAGTNRNIYNNIVGDLRVTTGTGTGSILNGLNISGGTAVNVYNNTVYLNNTSSGAQFGSSAISVATATNLTLRNNIFVNLSTPTGTRLAVAYRRSSTTLTSYQAASDNNLYYVGTASAQKLIFSDGTNADQTLATFKTRVSPRDGSSVTENPPFLSVVSGTPTYLHIDPTIATQIESGGTPVAIVADDIDGDVRNATTPDIGADEFAGVPLPVVKINSVSVSPSANQCVATPRTITANVTAGGQDITSVTLYYSFNGGAAVPVVMTGGTTTAGSTSDFTATIPAATPANAIVTWYVTAIDPVNSKTTQGTTYQDEPLSGITLTASATPAAVCEGSTTDLSVVVNTPAAVTTYTTPSVSTPATDEDLGNVTITQGATTILNNSYARNSLVGTIGTATGTAGGYSNFTAFGPYTLTPGVTYNFSAGVLMNATAYTNYVVAQIDYNRNGSFADAGETIYLPAATSSGAHTEGGAFTVPASAPFGKTRMRVFVNESATISTAPTISWGEYEDYMINIAPVLTFSWSDGATTVGTGTPVTVTPAGSTTYTVTATSASSGCTVTGTVAVTVNPLPTAPTTAPSTQCGTGVPSATASGGTAGQYRWYTVSSGGTAIAGETGSQLTLTSISATTTFYVAINNGSCESSRTPVIANVTAADAVHATISLPAVCPNSTVTLTATKDAGLNNYIYTWSATPVAGSGLPAPQTGTPLSITPTGSGSYTYLLTANDAVAGCTATATVSLTVNDVPAITSATATPATICEGGSSVLSAVNTVFEPGLSTSIGTETNLTAATAQPTAFCNRWSNYWSQTIYTAAELTAAGLSAGNITSMAYNITTPGDATTNANFNVKIGTIGSGTFASTTFVPTTSFTNVYGPATYTHTGSGLQTVNFTTPFVWDGTSNIVINVTMDGANSINNSRTYYSAKTDATLWVNSYTGATTIGALSPNRLNLIFGGIKATAGPALTWTWNPGNLSGSTVTVTPSGTTTYTVTADNGTCTNTAQVTVTVNPLPTAPAATNSIQCGTQVPTASVTDPNGYTNPTFTWYSASTGGTVMQTGTSNTYGTAVSATTTFYVSVTNPAPGGCESLRTPVTINVTAPPAVTVSSNAPSNTICTGSSATLTALSANAGYTYTWAAPISATGAVQTVTPAATTTYTVNAVDASGGANNGCATTADITITVSPLPSLSVTPAESLICGTGPAVALTATSTAGALFTENFEGGTLGNFTLVNETGSGPASTNWTVRTSPYATGGVWGVTINSGSPKFALTNSDVSGATVNTSLVSTAINTSSVSTLSLTFKEYYSDYSALSDFAKVDISTDGGVTWTNVRDGITTIGASGAFATTTIPLNTYINQSNLKFRFNYTAAWNDGWAVDDVVLSGTPLIAGGITYSWTPVAGLYTDAAGTLPYTGENIGVVYANPATTTTYTVTVDNGTCQNTATTIVKKNVTLNGTYLVGAGQAATGGFNTLTAAVKAYNEACLLGGPVTFSLADANYSTAETFPIIIRTRADVDATHNLTIKPATGVNATITSSVDENSLIQLYGADYVTIDGSNTVNGTTRNLTISNTDINGLGADVWIRSVLSPLNGATFNTIKNTNFLGATATGHGTAIISGGDDYIAEADAPNSNNSLINNSISTAQEGIFLLGGSATSDNNWLISKNIFGSTTTANKLAYDGMYLSNLQNYTIDSNTVVGVSNTNIGVITGLYIVDNHLNGTITRNRISDIKNTSSTGYGSEGIYLGASTTTSNITVANNFISNVASAGYNGFTEEDNGYGIAITEGGGYKLYHNTVVLNTNQTATSNRAAALLVTSGVTTAGSLDIRNNIFGNTQTTGGANSRYAVVSTADNNVYAFMDNNDYYSSGSGYLLCKGSNATQYNTIALLRTNLGNNLASVSIVPDFINLATGDLHLNTGTNDVLDGLGTAGLGVASDIDTDFRNTINPDMGADEFSPCSTGIYTWIGKTNTDWNEPSNWCANAVPLIGSSVMIPQGTERYPVLGSGIPGTGHAASIDIKSTVGSLTISSTGVLEVAGNFNNAGQLVNDGTIRMIGTGTFPGAGTIGGTTNNMNNLEIASSAGTVTLNRDFGITGQLLSTSGTLALADQTVTIVSSAASTANVGPVTGAFTYGTNGKFVVERYLPAKKAWRFIATPVQPSTTYKVFNTWQESGITPGTPNGYGTQITGPGAVPATNGLDVSTPGNSLKYYDPTQSLGFTMITNTRTTDLANEKGYMVFVRGDRSATVASGTNTVTTLRSPGQLITGTKTYTVPHGGLASVGNPYASRIDLEKVYLADGIGVSAGVVAAVTIWDPQVGSGANGVGLYRTYVRNAAGDWEQTPSGVVNNFIESGQAFYVQSNSPALDGTLTLKEANKTTGSQNVSRGGPMSRLRTNIFSGADTARELIDGTLIDLDAENENTIDNMDVRKVTNAAENLGMLSGGKNLIVERRKPFVVTDTVFYNMSGMKRQTYEFEFVPDNISTPNLTGFLEDNFLHTSTPVSLTSNTKVSFTVDANAGSAAANRFRLVFKQAVVLPVNFISIAASRNADRSIAVNWKVENEVNISKYTVERSADGRQFTGIITTAVNNTRNYLENDLSPLSADNYYRIKATSFNGQVQYSGVVKVAPSKDPGYITVNPRPAINKTVQVLFTNEPKGTYTLQLSSKLGQVIYNDKTTVIGSSFVKSIILTPLTPAGTYQLKVIAEDGTVKVIQVVIE